MKVLGPKIWVKYPLKMKVMGSHGTMSHHYNILHQAGTFGSTIFLVERFLYRPPEIPNEKKSPENPMVGSDVRLPTKIVPKLRGENVSFQGCNQGCISQNLKIKNIKYQPNLVEFLRLTQFSSLRNLMLFFVIFGAQHFDRSNFDLNILVFGQFFWWQQGQCWHFDRVQRASYVYAK